MIMPQFLTIVYSCNCNNIHTQNKMLDLSINVLDDIFSSDFGHNYTFHVETISKNYEQRELTQRKHNIPFGNTDSESQTDQTI